MRLFALLITVLLAACTLPTEAPRFAPTPEGRVTYTVLIAPEFSESQVSIILSALGEWRNVGVTFGYQVSTNRSENEEILDRTIKIRKKDLTDVNETGHAYWAGDEGCNIDLDPLLDKNWAAFHMVALHELGHCFHLPHYSEGRTIMHPKLSGMSPGITAYDRSVFCSLWDCAINSTQYE